MCICLSKREIGDLWSDPVYIEEMHKHYFGLPRKRQTRIVGENEMFLRHEIEMAFASQ